MCQHTLAALLSDLEQGMQVWAGCHVDVGWVAWSHKLPGVALFPQNVLKKFLLVEWFVDSCFVAVPSSQGLELNRSLYYSIKKTFIITCTGKLCSGTKLILSIQ